MGGYDFFGILPSEIFVIRLVIDEMRGFYVKLKFYENLGLCGKMQYMR